ncbi:transcription factor HIVEP2a [Mobula birostris]|uniref:transcription factor HIVEP2a n=1 Tax=Mobula birostris TaxID=1983395 RepID=UPI003B28644E
MEPRPVALGPAQLQEPGGTGQGSREWAPIVSERPRRPAEATQNYYRALPSEAPPPPPPPLPHPDPARRQHLLTSPYHYTQPPYPAFPRQPTYQVSGEAEARGPEGGSWQLSVQPELGGCGEPFLGPQPGKKVATTPPSATGYRHPQLGAREERKARKPGRHICQYCGRACAKPSVLKKHIRSHTGERPYPCGPCGFSFKTKSNLYKHRKSHAHAVKAGLAPAVSAEPAALPGEDAEPPPSDGDESTDTDEEVRLGSRPSTQDEVEAPGHGMGFILGDDETYAKARSGGPILPAEGEPLPHPIPPPMKVPILIVPRAQGAGAQSEAPPPAKAEPACHSPGGLGRSYSGQRAVKQKLALRLSEKRGGRDSEQSLHLLSPHSKGSTDSGYFSRSESAEQQASPPDTEAAKSYAEIIFGKFARLAPRSLVVNEASLESRVAAGAKEAGPDIERLIEEHIMRLVAHEEVLREPALPDSGKNRPYFLPGEGEGRDLSRSDKAQSCLLGVPGGDGSQLTRSNSMPVTTGSGLAVPQLLRGSHSFDERLTSCDGVLPPGSHQRLLKRQIAIELVPGLEAPSPPDETEATRPRGRSAPGPEEGEASEAEARRVVLPRAQGQNPAFECEACGIKYQFWDNFEAHRTFYCAPKPRAGPEIAVFSQASPHRPGSQGPDTLPFRKRRKEKSVGDEEEVTGIGDDGGSPYGGSSTSLASLCDSRAESLEQEPGSRATPQASQTHRPQTQPSQEEWDVPGPDEGPEAWPPSPQACRRPGGNEISVIQHTNSLSRPSSFERSESMEVTPAGDASPSEVQEGLPAEFSEAAIALPPPGLASTSGPSPQPKLVRQRNIQVPEIRVTEEPDRPEREREKEREPPAREPERVVEEFQWPQRSETLCQLPAEKLPPKKKRLRLAELEYSSGDSSSLDSGPPSRSPSQESNWSHGSGLSLSLEREEAVGTGSRADYLTVPPTAGSAGPQLKEMRRSASEQSPCLPCPEGAETRSKSFDYGSLSASSNSSSPPPPIPPPSQATERRRCFLVRQATLGLGSESPQIPEAPETMQLCQAYPRLRSPSPGRRSPGFEVCTQFQAKLPNHTHPFFQGEAQAFKAHPFRVTVSDAIAPEPEAWPSEGKPGARPGSWGRPTSPWASPQHSPSRAGGPGPTLASLPVIAAAAAPPPQLLVPVRIQAQVPSYGSVTYTSVCHSPAPGRRRLQPAGLTQRVESPPPTQRTPFLPWRLSSSLSSSSSSSSSFSSLSGTGLPEGVSPATAAATAGSSSKRVLSPASSLELVLENQQQKRVKEERICGQMMEKLSLRESSPSSSPSPASPSPSSSPCTKPSKPQLVRQRCTTELKEGRTSSPSSSQEARSGPVSEVEMATGESPLVPSPEPPSSSSAARRFPVRIAVRAPGTSPLPAEVSDSLPSQQQHLLPSPPPFPSLRSAATISWCFLSHARPSHARHATPGSSVYAVWCVGSYNPNPPGTPTKVALALLCSKQKARPEIYVTAAAGWPSAGKLVASSSWKQHLAQIKWYESSQQESDRNGRKTAASLEKEREKMEACATKDHGTKIEPTRIKIFDGGYKSNEDYVYVRGRGRGKYICEECGIRCKKPSMLKKHIRTHTDHRPFMCKFCNFAFKTKGNLTKHMKSKAHTKKCLELGITITCMYSTDTEETGMPDETEKDTLSEVPVRHQFSDPEDTDGAEEEGDEDEDDDDDDEDERQGDSTPTTRSRSSSPSTRSSKPASGTFSIASVSTFDVTHSNNQSSLMSYLASVPRIQVTQLVPTTYSQAGLPLMENQRHFHNRLMDSMEYRDRLDIPSTTGLWMAQTEDGSSREDSSREMSPSGDTSSSTLPSPAYEGSPGREVSPTSRRYLSPRRDLSPRPHLSPRREISPLRHRSPKRETHLTEWSPKRDASPGRHFLPRREILSPRQVSPAKDVSPRRELSPRRDYKERRHMPLIRGTSPQRGSFQGEYVMGQYMQNSEMNLRQSRQNVYDGSRPPPWPWFASDNAQRDQSHSLHPEPQPGCLFTHLPLHSQQQARAPYHMIPIGGIQMVQSAAPAFPGTPPAPRPSRRGRRREESGIDEATHCVIESIKGMDIISKAEEGPAPSPMAVSPPGSSTPEGPPLPTEREASDEGCTLEDQAPSSLLNPARLFAPRPQVD